MYFSKRILLLFCLVNLLSSNSFANNEPLYIKEFFNIDSNFYVKYAQFLFNIVNNLNLSSLFLNI